MGSKEGLFKAEFQIFKDFLTSVAKFEELGAVGSRLLGEFQQGLELLRRPPINRKSELIENIIRANETERFKSYMAAGFITSHDRIQNISKLHTCILGLHNHLTKAKSILNELDKLLEDSTFAIKTANGSFSPLTDEDLCEKFDQQAAINQEETSSVDLQELQMTDYAALMGSIYIMVKQDYMMQERIVTSLNLTSSSGEMESYCLMWSLHPYINDEIMQQAWRLIH
ncbi:uncharacterized protein LOC110629873 isoform X1 [Manihot esculenta]|uniref:DUF7795 domain-containing protein n=1 Tax=Manihot esculenta TaxID=3983 RepID=A0A2C9UQP2_MANES|nr:uncharacterized protein LOC110629873 isoform X1 [Manihot esculenta]OAY33538.1 hypothetical protein MANES_13G105100v8 [Manihot esculenta]